MFAQKTAQQTRRVLRPRVAAVLAPALFAAALAPAGVASASESAFECDPGFYQVIDGQLAELDPANEAYATIGPANSKYNAMGYRLADGLLYGMRGATLIRIDSSGTATTIATLDLPSGHYTGDFDDDGLLNVSRGGRDWHKIDVDTLEITPVPEFSTYRAVADITNVHGVFFGVSSDGALYSYDQTTLEISDLGVVSGLPSTLKAYGAAWSTAGGNLYVGRNSGEIYQITGYTTGSPTATLVGRAPATSSNDGASCSLAVPMAGLDDVDGPESESSPRTEEAAQAAEYYEENYEEISQGFTPIEPEAEPEAETGTTDDNTYTFNDSGMGTGPSCGAGDNVDRPLREAIDPANAVTAATDLYTTEFDATTIDDWTIRSGSWDVSDSALNQDNICGYDYTALLENHVVEDFRWQATFSGVTDLNQGGIVFNHASNRSRSGAAVVDLTDEGRTLRWGQYDDRGYYQQVGSMAITAPTAGQSVTLAVEVHRHDVTVFFNGGEVATFTTVEAGGKVGVLTSISKVSFDRVSLVALPPVAESSGANQ